MTKTGKLTGPGMRSTADFQRDVAFCSQLADDRSDYDRADK